MYVYVYTDTHTDTHTDTDTDTHVYTHRQLDAKGPTVECAIIDFVSEASFQNLKSIYVSAKSLKALIIFMVN